MESDDSICLIASQCLEDTGYQPVVSLYGRLETMISWISFFSSVEGACF